MTTRGPVANDTSASLLRWDLDILSLDAGSLVSLCGSLLHTFPWVWKGLSFDEATLQSIAEMTATLYACPGSSRVPYHNFLHAVDVLQATVVILQQTHLSSRFADIETAALLLSALFHDLGHPGVSNRQICETHGNAFWVFGEDSPLELSHMHGAMHILSRFKAPLQLKSLVGQLIMATDAELHTRDAFGETDDGGNCQDGDALSLMKLILCVADVSNIARPLAVRTYWAHAWGR